MCRSCVLGHYGLDQDPGRHATNVARLDYGRAEPGRPWENGCSESFNDKPGDESLTGEIFLSLRERQVIIGQRRFQGMQHRL